MPLDPMDTDTRAGRLRIACTGCSAAPRSFSSFFIILCTYQGFMGPRITFRWLNLIIRETKILKIRSNEVFLHTSRCFSKAAAY